MEVLEWLDNRPGIVFAAVGVLVIAVGGSPNPANIPTHLVALDLTLIAIGVTYVVGGFLMHGQTRMENRIDMLEERMQEVTPSND